MILSLARAIFTAANRAINRRVREDEIAKSRRLIVRPTSRSFSLSLSTIFSPFLSCNTRPSPSLVIGHPQDYKNSRFILWAINFTEDARHVHRMGTPRRGRSRRGSRAERTEGMAMGMA